MEASQPRTLPKSTSWYSLSTTRRINSIVAKSGSPSVLSYTLADNRLLSQALRPFRERRRHHQMIWRVENILPRRLRNCYPFCLRHRLLAPSPALLDNPFGTCAVTLDPPSYPHILPLPPPLHHAYRLALGPTVGLLRDSNRSHSLEYMKIVTMVLKYH